MNNNYNSLKIKVSKFENVTTRPMFGYQCFSINKKFFVGFNNKNDYQIIVRLSKEQQELAVKNNAIIPFSHGAKMGWIEIDVKKTTTASALKWITKGYENAKELSKKKIVIN
ncbi:MAG: TfoX/Sxy family protein [Nitrosarchaeum sp.]|nr:TfoX/Sxy family protein [Nitrosarchaeum sp.]